MQNAMIALTIVFVTVFNAIISSHFMRYGINGESTFITKNFTRRVIAFIVIVFINVYQISFTIQYFDNYGNIGVLIYVCFSALLLILISPTLYFGCSSIIKDLIIESKHIYKGPTKCEDIEACIHNRDYYPALEPLRELQDKYPHNIYVNKLALQVFEKLDCKEEAITTTRLLVNQLDDDVEIDQLLTNLSHASPNEAHTIRQSLFNHRQYNEQ
jgi:hypothetical protein